MTQAIAFSLGPIRPERDLPPKLRAEFNRTIAPAPSDERRAGATVRTLDDWQVRNAIAEVIRLYDNLCRYMPRRE